MKSTFIMIGDLGIGFAIPETAGDPSLTLEQQIMLAQGDELARLREIMSAVVAGYSRETGLLNIPELCRNMKSVNCFCGCHVSRVMDPAAEQAKEAT